MARFSEKERYFEIYQGVVIDSIFMINLKISQLYYQDNYKNGRTSTGVRELPKLTKYREYYCHTRLHLGFSAKLRIWQVPACKMEPQSDIIS